MKPMSILLLAGLVALAGCGGGDVSTASKPAPADDAAGKGSAGAAKAGGTRISVRGSRFGSMLWGPKRQAIYIFQRDKRNVSRCYGECARLWPPVRTRGKPVAGRGVRSRLLGTTRRRNGRTQVTYAGKPLYLYAHEGPDEVRCHNVNLNGGLWWVVGPDGKRRP